MSQTPTRAALDDLDHLRQMRDTHPVWRDPDTGAWTIYRYDDVAAALADPRTFSSNFGVLLAEHEDELLGGNILAMDPPRHDQLRSLVSQAFTPRAIGQLEGRIGELTEELLNQTRGAAQVELACRPRDPLRNGHCRVPRSTRRGSYALQEMGRRRGRTGHPRSSGCVGNRGGTTLVRHFHEYLREHVSRRRAEPRSDLLSDLIGAEIDGQRLSDDEIVGFATIC